MAKVHEQIDDCILWNEFRKGSHQAFGIIYSRFFSALYNYGKKFTQQNTLLEECAQELFVELWHSRRNLSNIHAIKPYLYKSFRRKLLRKLKQDTISSSLDIHTQHFVTEISREEEILNTERIHLQSQILQDALQSLSNRQREAIFLKFYDKLSYAEISEVMECDVKVAYDLVFKAIKKMRSMMYRKEYILLSMAVLLYFLLNLM